MSTEALKVMSFNINGIRARPHQLEEVVAAHKPHILGLQETKVQDSEFPHAFLQALSLHYKILIYGQKGHYGVALMYRDLELVSHRFGLPGEPDDAQRRMIEADFKLKDGSLIKVFNGYFPNGEKSSHPTKFPKKRDFYRTLTGHLQGLDKESFYLVMGDMNIAPEDQDIGIGEKNMKRWLRDGNCSFLPEEREWYQKIMALEMKDSYRLHAPTVADRFSWFDYRSKGFDDDPKRGLRIDHILLSLGLSKYAHEAGVDYAIRSMERPSDHCPIWATLQL